jgi:hypothetical protein
MYVLPMWYFPFRLLNERSLSISHLSWACLVCRPPRPPWPHCRNIRNLVKGSHHAVPPDATPFVPWLPLSQIQAFHQHSQTTKVFSATAVLSVLTPLSWYTSIAGNIPTKALRSFSQNPVENRIAAVQSTSCQLHSTESRKQQRERERESNFVGRVQGTGRGLTPEFPCGTEYSHENSKSRLRLELKISGIKIQSLGFSGRTVQHEVLSACGWLNSVSQINK